MARIGIFEEPPKKWFMYDSDTEVLISYVDKAALAKLVRSADEAARKLKENPDTVLDIFLGKAAVHSWRKEKDHDHPGLTLPNGAAIPFTNENRNKLMRHCAPFSSFVLAKSTSPAGYLDETEPTLGDDDTTLEKLLDEFELDGSEPKND